ncbi:GIY-YIG catalytic domain-containing protein [Chitinophaga sp. YR573]|uniref:GIY-YIG nuclease family protein n=1 Tax=Chitinophaga sp. YR573 TaxID=1881040 RepID=UPI0008CA7A5A|nr:GIY-YIG nuclease family protein [Chitinophaga sp. YR573]SEW05347.1 GIY-YIG catalytic domain-containing protein [Chitinophaga sp. YR573]
MKTKKELKEEYKQMKFKMGIFQIRNTLNNKIYIEGSINLNAIWNRHKMQLNFGVHPNPDLQQEWKEEHFRFEILAEIGHKDDEVTDYNKEIKLLESMYIEELQPFGEKGYNKRPISYI